MKIWRPGFNVRLFQMGDANTAFVLRTDQFAGPIRATLAHRGYRWVFHNAPYDLLALERTGHANAMDLHTRVEDTKILWHLIDPRGRKDGGHGFRLKDLARDLIDRSAPDTQDGLTGVFRKLRVPTDKLDRHGNPKTRLATKAEGWSLVPIDDPTYVLYAGLDVILTARLYDLGTELVEKQGNTDLAKWEHSIQHIGLAMERRGALVDVPWTEALAERWDREYEQHYERAVQLGVPNLNSARLVAEALERAGVELSKKTASGRYAADKSVLQPLADAGMELAQEILAAKRVRKRRSAYAMNMLDLRDEHDRVHPNLNTLQARTARMSISNPPFQQLPSKMSDWHIRRCVIAKPGHSIVSTDFDQMELRLAGAFANEPGIIKAAQDNRSIHKATAELLYGPDYSKDEYTRAKSCGFCKLYGGGAAKIAVTAGCSLDDARDVVRRFDEGYPNLRQYSWNLQAQVMEDAGVDFDAYRQAWKLDDPEKRKQVQAELTYGKIGYIRTPKGRWLPVEASHAFAATNYMIQSAARDVLCDGLLRADASGLGDYMILVVHDEVIAEVPESNAAEVAEAFSRELGTVVNGTPITANYEPGNVVGGSWGNKYASDDEMSSWIVEDEDEED